jgi:hypothetical protein
MIRASHTQGTGLSCRNGRVALITFVGEDHIVTTNAKAHIIDGWREPVGVMRPTTVQPDLEAA